MEHLSSKSNTPYWSLFSQYRGPLMRLDAAAPKPEEGDPPEGGEEGDPPSDPPEGGEEGDPPADPPEGDPPPGEDEDPLTTANPFEEGTPQHDAFEHQREKFRQKEEKIRKDAAEAAKADVGGQMDQILELLKGSAPPAADAPPPPPVKKTESKATPEDIEIVRDALLAQGIDPDEIVRNKRRQEVSNALSTLRETYPGVEFDDQALVKYANDTGLSQLSGSVHDVLELALMRKHGDKIRAGAGTPPPPPPPPEPKKKDPVPILQGGTTKKAPASPGDTPKDAQGWKQRILGKYSGGSK